MNMREAFAEWQECPPQERSARLRQFCKDCRYLLEEWDDANGIIKMLCDHLAVTFVNDPVMGERRRTCAEERSVAVPSILHPCSLAGKLWDAKEPRR